jgi:hypothetical protein
MKLLITFAKDIRLAFKSFYIYIEIIMAVLFVAILLFVVPEHFTTEHTVYVALDLPATARDFVMNKLSEGGEAGTTIVLLDSAEAVRARLEQDRSAAGIFISILADKINFEFILQGYEQEKVVNILRQAFIGEMAASVPGFVDHTTVTLLDSQVEKLSDRINMVPVFLVLNSVFVGLFIIASYIFMDKEEGTIKAFAVTPARVWHYLAAKVGVMMVTGLITGLITAVAVGGTQLHLFPFILLLLVCNGFGSVLGLLIASFFDSITKAMGWLYLAIFMLSFTSVSYYMPSFSPLLIRLLPSYPMLYAFRQIFLAAPDYRQIYTTVGIFAVLGLVIFLLADWRYRKTITI